MSPRIAAVLLGPALAVAGAVPLKAQEPHRAQLAEKLQRDLARAADAAPGVVGISVVDINTGQRFGVNDTWVFPQGSAIKIPILIELFRRADAGDLRLTERLPVRATDRTGGSGVLQHFSDGGSEFSLRDLAIPMIVLSDNTATNILIDRLGMERITRTMAELGAPQTRVGRKMIRPDEAAKGNENLSTAKEAADLMVRLAQCKLPVSAASCAEIRRILEIPKSGGFRAGIPANVAVAWKPGSVEGVATAWGLVTVPGAPYAIAIMINYGPDDMNETLRDVSALAYRYFAQIARTTPHGARVPLEVIRK